jgi:hypothetical protein
LVGWWALFVIDFFTLPSWFKLQTEIGARGSQLARRRYIGARAEEEALRKAKALNLHLAFELVYAPSRFGSRSQGDKKQGPLEPEPHLLLLLLLQ